MKLYEIDSVRTNNFSKDVGEKIGQLWSQVMSQVQNDDTVIYGIYHDYENDYHGDYTLTIASEQKTVKRLLDIPSQKYELFPVDTTSEIGVIEAWQKVWSLEEESKIERTYQYDFEKYDLDGTVTLYIGIQ
ncbi:GyrI-like domain-containing protein [Enterococcus rivorum]|uniref:AraC effector-binding domain-containing protein n=1 Tax=Enterococcus rivorum TaxID=762845 RepID=A0A1E5KYQ5_9ENTE|nr:effector binding domain-containing protein [Enterococcus rivorum]MBP2097474.1 putative transcriptional regulator YdeE [Enterococcus rivorum]OEH82934.1 hypothetical protein BCR26_01270 [Enterococcus rivorum]